MIDLGKLKNLHTGLGQTALAFGNAVSAVKDDILDFNFLLPPGFESHFGSTVGREFLSLRRRYFPNLCRDYDLWHALHQDSAYFPGNPRTAYLLTINDLNFLEEKSGFKAGQRLRRLQKKVNRAGGITAISSYVENRIKENLKVPDIPLRTVYYGVDIDNGETVSRPPFAPNSDFLFSIGVIREKKNFGVLIDFIKLMPGFKLIIAGNDSNEYAGILRDRIDNLELRERVIMPGEVNHGQRLWLYENCRAFLFPSKYEGFGLPVIEAMTKGKPVFLSTFTSLPEIGGKHAFYWNDFHPEKMKDVFLEGMAMFSGDPSRSERMKTYARGFTWDNCVKSYIEIYKQLLGAI